MNPKMCGRHVVVVIITIKFTNFNGHFQPVRQNFTILMDWLQIKVGRRSKAWKQVRVSSRVRV